MTRAERIMEKIAVYENAGGMVKQVQKAIEMFNKHPYVYTTGAGAIGGGVIGALGGIPEEGSPLKGAAIGAITGGTAGAGLTAGTRHLWNKIHPMYHEHFANKLQEMATILSNPKAYV